MIKVLAALHWNRVKESKYTITIWIHKLSTFKLLAFHEVEIAILLKEKRVYYDQGFDNLQYGLSNF